MSRDEKEGEVTGYEPQMWGPSIIGFGSYHYRYESGHEGDAPHSTTVGRENKVCISMKSL